MNLIDLVEKAVEGYRHTPIMDGSLNLESRMELRTLIGAVASQKHLRTTLSEMRSAGYQENSPALKVFKDRLRNVETTLKTLEGKYGKITSIQYQT